MAVVAFGVIVGMEIRVYPGICLSSVTVYFMYSVKVMFVVATSFMSNISFFTSMLDDTS